MKEVKEGNEVKEGRKKGRWFDFQKERKEGREGGREEVEEGRK